uniref:Uncharacterized protein n=1 Tax=Solanum lycopersicum TaxID=4081 RepID=A0A3Q7FHT7_SOLLC
MVAALISLITGNGLLRLIQILYCNFMIMIRMRCNIIQILFLYFLLVYTTTFPMALTCSWTIL